MLNIRQCIRFGFRPSFRSNLANHESSQWINAAKHSFGVISSSPHFLSYKLPSSFTLCLSRPASTVNAWRGLPDNRGGMWFTHYGNIRLVYFEHDSIVSIEQENPLLFDWIYFQFLASLCEWFSSSFFFFSLHSLVFDTKRALLL